MQRATARNEPATARPGILSADDIAAFERDGFVIRRGVFDAEEIAEIGRWTADLGDLPETPGRHMMYFEKSLLEGGRRILNRIENFYPYHTGFSALIDGPKLWGAVAQLLDQPPVLFKEKINFKLPGGDGFKPHQDQQAGWSTYADYFVTALVSVDEATLENGCLELAAGQHRKGLIGKEWEPLTEKDLESIDMRPCPTRPGDVVFFDSFAPHGSGPNVTDHSRRVLYVTYNRASAGDHRLQYYADKRASYPPDIERDPNKEYAYRV